MLNCKNEVNNSSVYVAMYKPVEEEGGRKHYRVIVLINVEGV